MILVVVVSGVMLKFLSPSALITLSLTGKQTKAA